MRRSQFLLALKLPLLLSLFGCSEDVGRCDDPKRGLDTVVVSGKVMFAGQAIMNKACATGCHAASAKGAARLGAPAGLDFDLTPLSGDSVTGSRTKKDGVTVLELDEDALAGLRKRRTKVFQERNEIWTQVVRGLMPPSPSTIEAALGNVFASPEDEPCTRGREFSELNGAQAREVLREWLACGAPVVEAEGEEVSELQAVGTVGYQYPVCEGPAELTVETILQGPLGGCGSCHPTLYPPDISSVDALRALITASAPACKDKPWVTPGEPDNSFLYEIIAEETPDCSVRMPFGLPPLSDDEIEQVAEWIRQGAP